MTVIYDTCDDILDFMLSNRNQFERGGDKEVNRFKNAKIEQALNLLLTSEPKYIQQRNTSLYYELTEKGVEFAKNGGYSGQRQRDEQKRIEEATDKELQKMVSESTLKTNQSISKTNDSIQTLNDKTGDIYVFQKWATGATILVAIAAVVVASLAYINDKNTSGLSKLLIQQILKVEQSQKRTDSLKELLMLERVKNQRVTSKDSVAK